VDQHAILSAHVREPLIHVSGRLVEIRKWCHVGDDREDVSGVELDVSGIAGYNLGICTGDRHVRLLEWSDIVQLAQRQILDGSVHACDLREHEHTRVLAAIRCRDVTDFKLQWHIVCALDLPISQCVCNSLGLLGRAEAQDAAVELYYDTRLK
jgi:hypothetical protein